MRRTEEEKSSSSSFLSDFAIQWLLESLTPGISDVDGHPCTGAQQEQDHHEHHHTYRHYLNILEKLPMRTVLKFCTYLSAFELEKLLNESSTNERGDSCECAKSPPHQFKIIIHECFERLFRKRFEEDERSMMAFKLKTKQDQLLMAASNVEKDFTHHHDGTDPNTETDFIQLYFQNYLHQCVNSVLENKQIHEFEGSRVAEVLESTTEDTEEFLMRDENDDSKHARRMSFLQFPIPNKVSDPFFTRRREFYCKNNTFQQASHESPSLYDHLHRYGKYVRALSISKSLLKYLRESEQLQQFMECFEKIEELTFRDMREEDTEFICSILQAFTPLQKVSFYHSFFSESSLNVILNLIFSENGFSIIGQKMSISHLQQCFSDSIVQKVGNDSYDVVMNIQDTNDDDLDLYGDLFDATTFETTENSKKRPLSSINMDFNKNTSNLETDIESTNKKLKTLKNVHLKLTHITFRSVSFFQSSSELLGKLLSTHTSHSLDHQVQEEMLTLNFSFNELTSKMVTSLLAPNPSQFMNLTTLILTENNIDNDFLIYLSLQKPLLKTLTKLDLSNNHIVGVKGINALFESLQNEKSYLEFVNLSHNRLGGTSMFNDDYHEIGNCEIESLNSYLSSLANASLKTLLLSDCDLTSSMLQSLLLAITHNKSVITLDISYNAMKTNALAVMLFHNTTLRHLSVSCCALEEISQSLLKSLLQNETLTYLDLSGNRLKDVGGVTLVSYLKQKLEQCIQKKTFTFNTLDLSTNRFGEQFCYQLTSLFQNYSHQVDNFHIDTLLLENNFFSQEATQKLKNVALQSGMISRIALTNEDGKAQVYVQPCDGTTLT
ncbi:hypothetical protein FDP41_009183 [Naegleria fowleri]|uniref:F-box domain-containing protein n=1 Tax=Naegleria fowleri TaxID=5763 RepID=A0A6A5BDX9_NAEFO|nr:uncharacterized protein FDP41_009183 [Naegleria fowleri]KAF0972280.1 hypothetical protein FDP41_009183 [Naegleria fowleri]